MRAQLLYLFVFLIAQQGNKGDMIDTHRAVRHGEGTCSEIWMQPNRKEICCPLVLLHSRVTSWDVARVCYGGAQGLSHNLVSAKRILSPLKGYPLAPREVLENRQEHVKSVADICNDRGGAKQPCATKALDFEGARCISAGAVGRGKIWFQNSEPSVLSMWMRLTCNGIESGAGGYSRQVLGSTRPLTI